MAQNNADIELLAGLGVDSSETEILKGIKIIQKRLRANHDARFKLNLEIDENVIRNTVDKLQNILNSKELSIDTRDSIKAITKEVNAMADIVTVARKASTEKLEFAKANKKVKESADNTADAINRELNAMNSLDDIDTILNNINMSGRHGNSVFQQFGTTLRDAFYAFTAANLLEDAIYKVIDAGKEGIETVKELNDVATSLRMATGESYESVKNLLDSYNEMGQELGALTTEIADSADSWLRQNHTIEDTNVLIKDSMMLSKISNLETADSTKYLTSVMQGYKVAVNDVVGIVDKLSAVDLVSATDAGGLAEAMSRTAEGAQIAGISMDRLLGMIATTGEVTQKEMTSIGESYKTIFARMRDIKDNKLSFVGDDGEIEDISNVEIVLEGLGIKLRKSNQEFRNFQDVLDEVASSWNSYSSVQQAAIAKSFSGVRQAENFLVMMENWDKVIKYTDVAANSSGTSEEKFEYYLGSLEAKTNSLIASLENLASTTISDQLYGSVLDVSKSIVDVTAQTGILKNALIGLGTAGSVYTIGHLTTYLRDAAQGFSNLSEAMDITRNGTVGINDMQRLIDLTGGLSQSQTRLLLSTHNMADAQKVEILMNQNMSQAEAENAIQAWNVATAQQGAASATITFSGALRGLWATMQANPLILITTVVTVAVTAFNKFREAQEQSAQELVNMRKELSETTSELESITDELENVNKQIDEILAKDKIEIVDENELKKLREEVGLLEEKKKLLAAQEYEQQQETNRLISEKYNKYFKTAIVTTPDGSIIETDALSYFEDLYKQAEKYALSENPLTNEEKLNFENIKNGAVDLGLQLTDLLEDFKPLTVEEEKQKEAMEAMLHYATGISDMYAGTSYEIGERLVEKFASGEDGNSNKLISDWINSLSDKDKRILIQCDLDNASLNDLKAYLAEQIAEISNSESIDISDIFTLKDFSNEATLLSHLKDKLSDVKSAYETCLSAKEEYDEQGYLSVDTLQKVISLGDEYLQYLFDEQGNVKLDAEAFKKLTLARINDMEAQALQNLAENIKQITDEATATDYLAQKQNELASSYTDVAINALLAMQQINGFSNSEALQDAYNSFKTQYEQIKSLFANTRSGLDKEFSGTVTSASKDAEQATKDYVKSYMDYMEKSLDTARIDYKTYSRDVAKFLKDMYDQGKIAAKDYHDYTKQMLEVQKSIYDAALSAVTKLMRLTSTKT